MILVRPRLSSPRTLDRLHSNLLGAMEKALEAASPNNLIRDHVKLQNDALRVDGLTYRLKRFRRIFIIGAGKASGYMAEEMERILGPRITGGLVIVPDYLRRGPEGRRVEYQYGSHPFPSSKNLRAVDRMLGLVRTVAPTDLVVTVLSGGSSALMELPLKGIRLDDERKVSSLLLNSGADIHEINTVRKHISQVKGGRLARLLQEAQLLTLIISDVVADRVDAIGSGPTAPDPTTYRDSKQVLDKYNLWSRIPIRVRKVIRDGISGVLGETPKESDKAFRSVKNVIVGRNRESCKAAEGHMRKSGYASQILSTRIEGEASVVGHILGSILTEIRDVGLPHSPPAALIAGGETTVTVRGGGRGGRNQELALAGAIGISGTDGLAMCSMATDGVDGPTDAAGAMVDSTTVERGRRLGMDAGEYLLDNDSYHYFSKLGDLVKTGPTGTNVNDIMIVAADSRLRR